MASCDVDPEVVKVLTAALTVKEGMTAGGSRRKRMRGGMRVIAAVKALNAALCKTVRMTVSDAVNYPAGLMQPVTDFLTKIHEDTETGKAAKNAFYTKIKTILTGSIGAVTVKDLASPNSRIVAIAIVVLNALNDSLPNPLQVGIQALPDLTSNLALMATSAAPVINTALVTAASFWALRAVKRRVIDPFVNTIFEVLSKVPEELSDEKTDEAIDKAIDAVMAQVPQLAHMALSAGRGAVRAAGTVWAGRLRGANQANPEAAVVAGAAIGAGAEREAVDAALSAEGPAANPADVAEIVEEAAASADAPAGTVAGRRRTRKLRKMRNTRRKRTLRRKY